MTVGRSVGWLAGRLVGWSVGYIYSFSVRSAVLMLEETYTAPAKPHITGAAVHCNAKIYSSVVGIKIHGPKKILKIALNIKETGFLYSHPASPSRKRLSNS